MEKLFNLYRKNKGFLLFLFVFVSIRWSFADHYRVPTGSMLPTIQIGDHVLVNKMAYDLRLPFTDFVLKKTGEPKRGDIIVFDFPKDPDTKYVKRLVGLPGDIIEINQGVLKVNGSPTITLNEAILYEALKSRTIPFKYNESLGGRKYQIVRHPSPSQESLRFKIPPEQYFVLGDNRDNSYDSRFWGFVPRENLRGEVTGTSISVTFENLIPKFNFNRFAKVLI
ncbi:MAG: signal peptidase I [Bacteriovoracaceae bacterium]|nr:signal peptidase I [Bacteriovoracaceae bacterium]